MDEPATTGLTVAQMAAATGVSPHTLRYYEKAGLIEPVARNSGNQRRYSEADIEWLQFLLRLRETGMPIAQMREYAALRTKGPQTTAARLSLLEKHQAARADRPASPPREGACRQDHDLLRRPCRSAVKRRPDRRSRS